MLEAVGILKHFGEVFVLKYVDLKLKYNEKLGIVEYNGTGKSNPIKIISRVLEKYKGKIYFKGEEVNINNPRGAINLGIETVYQNLNLIDSQDVPFNIFLGRELVYGSGFLKK